MLWSIADPVVRRNASKVSKREATPSVSFVPGRCGITSKLRCHVGRPQLRFLSRRFKHPMHASRRRFGHGWHESQSQLLEHPLRASLPHLLRHPQRWSHRAQIFFCDGLPCGIPPVRVQHSWPSMWLLMKHGTDRSRLGAATSNLGVVSRCAAHSLWRAFILRTWQFSMGPTAFASIPTNRQALF